MTTHPLPDETPASDASDALLAQFDALKPWWDARAAPFTREDWVEMLRVAQLVQRSKPEVVVDAIDRYLKPTWGSGTLSGHRRESRIFLLLRVVFDLPEDVPVEQRRIFVGWANWPTADAQGRVNLAWPISWKGGEPKLLAPCAGGSGRAYDGGKEYKHLLERFSFRDLE